MQKFEPLRQVNPVSDYGKNDVLVVFGEVFARGYV
ncbi:MAG: enoyl ACP reductase FabMG family protein, partial [Bradyrhizobium sp.]